MENFHHILHELRETAPAVANLEKSNPYRVPDGYFNSLSDNILQNVMGKTYPENSFSFSKEETYAVPQGYFEGLSGTILNRIRVEQTEKKSAVYLEMEQIAPLLNRVEKKPVYHVPADYFNSFHVNTGEQATKPATARVVPLQNSFKRWINYAAAASVLFILSASSYMYVNHHLKGVDRSLTIGQRLASLKEEDIVNYLNNDLGDAESVIPAGDSDPDVNHLLINASDEELEHYLDSDSGSGENEIMEGI